MLCTLCIFSAKKSREYNIISIGVFAHLILLRINIFHNYIRNTVTVFILLESLYL